MENGYLFSNLICILVFTFELFIYSLMGTLVTSESEKMANVIWSLGWHDKDPRIRFYYRHILQRCQKPCKIMALQWVPSSLVSLKSVLSISFNMFSLLRCLSGNKGRF